MKHTRLYGGLTVYRKTSGMKWTKLYWCSVDLTFSRIKFSLPLISRLPCQFAPYIEVNMSVCPLYRGCHVRVPLISRLPCQFAPYIEVAMSVCPLYRGYHVSLPLISRLPCQFAPYIEVAMSVCPLYRGCHVSLSLNFACLQLPFPK